MKCNRGFARAGGILLALLLAVVGLIAAPPIAKPPASRIEALFSALRSSPPELYAFLFRMPKGADLHVHVSGAVYAENLIDAAAKGGLCISRQTLAVANPSAPGPGACASPDEIDAARAKTDNILANAVIDSFSMRDFVPGRESAHDHFFATFGRFMAAKPPQPATFVAEVVRRAAEQNESYLELMALNSPPPIMLLGKQTGFSGDFEDAAAKLRSAGIADLVADLKKRVDDIENSRRALLACDNDPTSAPCKVTVRYIFQVLRESPAEQVFAQVLAGFMLASIDSRVVAVNFVQPEDGINSMHDYPIHMQMVSFVKGLYPNVHISLHAGELASGLVPPEGLRFHITQAIETGHAERIGHGVSVMYEKDALRLLDEMKKKRIAVEINLTSNDVILGVSGKDHPFPVYRKFGVPTVISTDDEGVSRTHLTQEYLRAVLTYGLTYADLKELVRNSIEYSFLSGASYWTAPGYRVTAKACSGGGQPQSCQSFLAGSEKARVQADLEDRFREFEKSLF